MTIEWSSRTKAVHGRTLPCCASRQVLGIRFQGVGRLEDGKDMFGRPATTRTRRLKGIPHGRRGTGSGNGGGTA